MSPPFPSGIHALHILLDAILTGPIVLALLVILPAALAPQLYKLRPAAHVDALLPPSDTARTRPLVFALLIIPSTRLTRQLGPLSPLCPTRPAYAVP